MPTTVHNSWRPDFCGCYIHFTWDADVPSDSRAHTYDPVPSDTTRMGMAQNPTGRRFYDWDALASELKQVSIYKDGRQDIVVIPGVTLADYINGAATLYQDETILGAPRTVAIAVKRERHCPPHSLLIGQPWHDALLEESRRKELVWSIVNDSYPAANRDDGYIWNYDNDTARVLRVSFPTLTLSAPEIATLQAAIDIRVGPGLVVFV